MQSLKQYKFKSHIPFVAFGLASLVLVGCNKAEENEKSYATNNAVAEAENPAKEMTAEGVNQSAALGSELMKTSGSCAGNDKWLTSPALPLTVGDTNCSFHQYAWQAFSFLIQKQDNKKLNFENWMPSYGVFVGKDEEPTPWGSEPDIPAGSCSESINVNKLSHVLGLNTTGSKERKSEFSDSINQAGSDQPLIDWGKNYVFYDILVNKTSYDFITECELYKSNCASTLVYKGSGIPLPSTLAFPSSKSAPDNSFELKTAWMILDDKTKTRYPSSNYFTTSGVVKKPTGINGRESGMSCVEVELALVGMHVVGNSPNHPEFIWATFEHKDNAPDCSDLTAKPPIGEFWNFYDEACEGDKCDVTNTYFIDAPAQVCRENPYGGSTNTSGLSLDKIKNLKENTAHIKSINTYMQQAIASLSSSNKAFSSVWQNYELSGNVWTINGALPPIKDVQAGSLSAANTTMETYVQNGLAGINYQSNCFDCHTIKFGEPAAGLSHIFDKVQADTGGCSDNKLPAGCPVAAQ